MKEILKKTKKLSSEERRLLIVDLLRQQKRETGDEPVARDFCTLIDLSTGIIAGSGICPICHGFMGRQDDYIDNE